MNALALISAAHEAGISLLVDVNELAMGADHEPPRALVDKLADNAAEIAQLLTPDATGWNALDWHVLFAEQAGFLEHDCGKSRTDAAAQSYRDCVNEWMHRNPRPSAPGRCAHCGESRNVEGVVVPFLTGAEKQHTWLHHQCWKSWNSNRQQEAREALARYQILEPKT